jgi:uncharacterized protein YbbC (DUF1343 family)
VIPCRGWQRQDWLDETGLPWVLPSPNMPTVDTAGLYPGLCLVEATTLSEGRGTTRPFHLVGAPWINAQALVKRLRDLDFSGIGVRAARFRPEFGKHGGAICSGVELHLRNRHTFEPVAFGLHLLKTIHDLHPENFEWRAEPYEFVGDVPALDILTGSSAARESIENGRELDPLVEAWRQSVAAFEEQLDGVLLYHQKA